MALNQEVCIELSHLTSTTIFSCTSHFLWGADVQWLQKEWAGLSSRPAPHLHQEKVVIKKSHQNADETAMIQEGWRFLSLENLRLRLDKHMRADSDQILRSGDNLVSSCNPAGERSYVPWGLFYLQQELSNQVSQTVDVPILFLFTVF